jgi:hypothetical protein
MTCNDDLSGRMMNAKVTLVHGPHLSSEMLRLMIVYVF